MGIKVAIVTSNAADTVRQFNTIHGISGFEVILGGRQLFGKAKLIQNSLAALELKPHEAVVYIGAETRDIDAAKQVGLKCIAVK